MPHDARSSRCSRLGHGALAIAEFEASCTEPRGNVRRVLRARRAWSTATSLPTLFTRGRVSTVLARTIGLQQPSPTPRCTEPVSKRAGFLALFLSEERPGIIVRGRRARCSCAHLRRAQLLGGDDGFERCPARLVGADRMHLWKAWLVSWKAKHTRSGAVAGMRSGGSLAAPRRVSRGRAESAGRPCPRTTALKMRRICPRHRS